MSDRESKKAEPLPQPVSQNSAPPVKEACSPELDVLRGLGRALGRAASLLETSESKTIYMVLVQEGTQPSVEEFSNVADLLSRLREVQAEQRVLVKLNPYLRCSVFLFSGSRWYIEPYPWKLVADGAVFQLDTDAELETPTDSFWQPQAATEGESPAEQKTDDGGVTSD